MPPAAAPIGAMERTTEASLRRLAIAGLVFAFLGLLGGGLFGFVIGVVARSSSKAALTRWMGLAAAIISAGWFALVLVVPLSAWRLYPSMLTALENVVKGLLR